MPILGMARVPPDLWREIKKAAADLDTNAQAITAEALTEWLGKNKQRLKAKRGPVSRTEGK